MVDAALAIAAGLLTGSFVPFHPGPAALALFASWLLARRRMGAGLLLVVFLSAAVACYRAGRAISAYEARRQATIEHIAAPLRCEAEGVVESSPVLLRGTLRFHAELAGLVCEGRSIPGRYRARLYDGPADLARGDRVEVIANLGVVQLFHNADLGDSRPYAARSGVLLSGGALDVRITGRGRGPPAWIDRARASVRAQILATFPSDVEPLARALVLGEDDLEPHDGDAFRKSGLAHLLAVSGTHLTFAVISVVAALTAIARRIEALSARTDVARITAAMGVLLAWVYADFAGGSGSAKRAAAMLSVVFGAQALGRKPNGARAFGASTVAIACLDPLSSFDLSFTLSLAATGGLLGLGPWLHARMVEPLPALLRKPMTAVVATLSATIPCSPLLAMLAPTLPAAGVLANVLAVPIGELVALPVCLAHAVLGFWPSAQQGAAILGSGALIAVRAIARTTASIPWLAVSVPSPTAWQAAILAVTGAALALGFARGRRGASLLAALGAALLVAEAAAIRIGAPRGRLRITSLDVGQGDATLIDFPDGRSMLIDGGGLVGSPVDTGRAVILPVHRARRRAGIDVAVLSHPHPDHYLGLASALPELEVGELWDTGQGEAEGAGPEYHALLANLREREVPILRPDALCGRPHRFGGAQVEVLAPCPEPTPFINANDNSFVLRITFGRHAALLTGDSEHDTEARLVRTLGPTLRADLLKVGHHGSRTSSTPAFLAAVGPLDAIVSCGIRNRFGHPHGEAMASLEAAGARILRTDRLGSIVWETDGERISLSTAVRAR